MELCLVICQYDFVVSELYNSEQVWEKVLGVGITDAANAEMYNPEQLANQIACKSSPVNQIGFIGLGAMGFGMATHLLRSNFCVLGYDVILYVQFLLHYTSTIKLLV